MGANSLRKVSKSCGHKSGGCDSSMYSMSLECDDEQSHGGVWGLLSTYSVPSIIYVFKWKNIHKRSNLEKCCGSGAEPASCYRKVVGSAPLVCMLKCPWARPYPTTAPGTATAISA